MKAISNKVIVKKLNREKIQNGLIIPTTADATRTEGLVYRAAAHTGLQENDLIVAHDLCYQTLDPEQQLYYINLYEIAAVIK